MKWITNGIYDFVNGLIYKISSLIYQLIIWLYDIFMKLCNSRVLDSEVLELIASRIGVILGIIMLFMVIFSVIQMILEPDKLTDKEKGVGNIVKKVLIVIVMLGMSTSAFSLLYGVQRTIIESNIIAKFLLPYEVNTDNFGGLLAAELFTAFYHFDESLEADGLTDEEEKCKNSVNTLKGEIITYGTFTTGNDCLDTKSGDTYVMDFNWLLSPIVGALAVYFIFSYCLSVGMRTFQLAFLEIIAPMAIVSHLSPKKDTMFNKWWKIYSSTYLDVFLRIAIINVTVFLIAVIFDANMSGTFWESVGGKTGTWYGDTIMTVFIIMSLLMFAKKAPDLLKELFPASASKLGLGITPPKKLLDNMLFGNQIYGAGRVATGRAIGNLRNAAGKWMDANEEYKQELAKGDAADEEKLKELRAKRNAWAWRGARSFVSGAASGMVAGSLTKDQSGRKHAISSGVKSKKNIYKTRDAGYTLGNQVNDYLRYGMWNRDTNLEDMAALSDMATQTLKEQINALSQKHAGKVMPTVSKNKRGSGFVMQIGGGDPITFANETELTNYINSHIEPRSQEMYKDALQIAKLSSQAGKAAAKATALRNAKEEQKKG